MDIQSNRLCLDLLCFLLELFRLRGGFAIFQVHEMGKTCAIYGLFCRILDNQEAFRYGAMEEFGLRNEHFEEDGEIISRETIEESIAGGIAYRIIKDGAIVGGMVLRIEGSYGELELLFVTPKAHSKGIGYAAWCAVEAMYPEVEIWETCTPYFEKRNIHFYVNCCGFHIVEFFNSKHPDSNEPNDGKDGGFDGMFRFEKIIKRD